MALSRTDESRRIRSLVACGLFLALVAAQIALIVYLDNTNLATTNGLWKAPWVHAWETGTGRPMDTGDLLYMPGYGFLCRLIPDWVVSYGVPGSIVTYRKMAMLNSVFSAISSCGVFLLALLFTDSLFAAMAIALAHACMGFVLLHGLNSEDVTPAYAFFVLAVVSFFQHARTRRLRWLILCAGFIALTAVFHWTLLIPLIAAVGISQLVLVVKRKHPVWTLAAFPLAFLASIWFAGRLAGLFYPESSFGLVQLLYPSKAGPSGWLGFASNKLVYAVIGIGNYFIGAQQLSDYQEAFRAHLWTMTVSWVYFAAGFGAAALALTGRRIRSDLRLLACFCMVLFAVAELEHLYSQPQDPQSQVQPMFLSVGASIIVLVTLSARSKRRAFHLATAGLAAISLAIGVWNVKLMAAARGVDSQSVLTVKQLARTFPPDRYTKIAHAYEGWNTWWYLDMHQGDWSDYVAKNIHLLTPFTEHPGISGPAAAAIVKKRIDKALAGGHRVVTCSLWTQDRATFLGLMSTVVDSGRAGAYYDTLRFEFRAGRGWDTPAGFFVELHSAGAGL